MSESLTEAVRCTLVVGGVSTEYSGNGEMSDRDFYCLCHIIPFSGEVEYEGRRGTLLVS